jgi:hypothetical protein
MSLSFKSLSPTATRSIRAFPNGKVFPKSFSHGVLQESAIRRNHTGRQESKIIAVVCGDHQYWGSGRKTRIRLEGLARTSLKNKADGITSGSLEDEPPRGQLDLGDEIDPGPFDMI